MTARATNPQTDRKVASHCRLEREVCGRTVYRRDVYKPDGRRLFLYGYSPHDLSPIDGDPLNQLVGSELRWHPLRQEWAVYADARQHRPFQPSAVSNPLAPSTPGKMTEIPFEQFEVCVFENRFPSFAFNQDHAQRAHLKTAPADGACEVIVYSEAAEGSLATIGQERRRLILESWVDRYAALLKKGCDFVLPFENRGDEVGVTLHHPHGQIYGFPFTPAPQQSAWRAFSDGYDLAAELIEWRREYGISEAGGLLAFAPPFARFPFEVWIAPFNAVPGPWAFDEAQADGFAHLLGEITRRYDTLFGRATPYMLTLHAAPRGAEDVFQFTAQFYPLLRAPDRIKYLASVEQASGVFTVDILPERAAKDLREVL